MVRVLVIDDCADTTSSCARLLTRWGHEVRQANDGASALEIAAGFLPEAVLVDSLMPRMGGDEVGRRLRSIPGLEPMVLIAVSGYPAVPDAAFSFFLLKPVELDELRRVLDAVPRLLSRPSPPA
jgi:CheY-like chemotaxis protein